MLVLKDKIYTYAPCLLALMGLIMGVSSYFLYNNVLHFLKFVFWIVMLLAGFILGKLIKKLNEEANRDPLTGLSNRRYFYNRLLCEMEKFKKTPGAVFLAIIDIDDFKRINDTYGHVEGDRVLSEISSILKDCTRSKDTVVRWGGEEFAIILPETDIDSATEFAECIRRKVECCDSLYRVTLCIGLAFTKEYTDIHKLIAVADRALYKAKEKKNLVVRVENSTFVEIGK